MISGSILLLYAIIVLLRDIDSKELVRKSVEQKLESMLKNAGKKSKREIDEKDIADVFGL